MSYSEVAMALPPCCTASERPQTMRPGAPAQSRSPASQPDQESYPGPTPSRSRGPNRRQARSVPLHRRHSATARTGRRREASTVRVSGPSPSLPAAQPGGPRSTANVTVMRRSGGPASRAARPSPTRHDDLDDGHHDHDGHRASGPPLRPDSDGPTVVVRNYY